jgi:arylsulfatase A-like enzyme
VSAFWDIMPTLAEVTGSAVPEVTDGISFLPELLGKKQIKHDFLYWEFHEQGGKAAVRMGEWKAVKLNADKGLQGPTELYDLATDTGETTDVASLHPDIVRRIEEIMVREHTRSEVFPFAFELIKDPQIP